MNSKLSPLYSQLLKQETSTTSSTTTTPRKPPTVSFSVNHEPLNVTSFVNTDFGFHKERLQDVGWSRHKDSPRHQEELVQDIQTSAVKHIHTVQTPATRGSKATENVHNLYTILDHGSLTTQERGHRLHTNSMVMKRHSGSTSDLTNDAAGSNPLAVSMRSRSLVNLSQVPIKTASVLPCIADAVEQSIQVVGKHTSDTPPSRPGTTPYTVAPPATTTPAATAPPPPPTIATTPGTGQRPSLTDTPMSLTPTRSLVMKVT